MNSNTVAVRYIVNNVDQAIPFYCDLLGFRVEMHPAPGFAALSKGQLRLFLNQPGVGGAGQKISNGQSPQPGGWNRIQIQENDLDSLYRELKEKGARFKSDIITGQGGRQLLLLDPSGNLVELFEPAKPVAVQPVPEGFHTVTPFLLADDAIMMIEFLKNAFQGEVAYMMKSDDGILRHATVRIGDSLVMVSNGTELYKPVPCMLHLYVKDIDAVYERAIKAGGISVRGPEDEFYGDRTAGIRDHWNNQWWIATKIENVSEDEIKRREREFRKEKGLR